jgi:hypothetical protein
MKALNIICCAPIATNHGCFFLKSSRWNHQFFPPTFYNTGIPLSRLRRAMGIAVVDGRAQIKFKGRAPL